jgi:phosphohistidine phosphatase
MKTLLIVRHAKSVWRNEFGDFERTLKPVGTKEASTMAEFIATKISKVDKIISSPAVRALTTSKIFAKAFNYEENDIEKDFGFYDRGIKYIINVLAAQKNENDVVMIFGHNPTVSSLVTYFSGESVGELPPCSVSCIDFDMVSWLDIDKINGKLRFFEKPAKG